MNDEAVRHVAIEIRKLIDPQRMIDARQEPSGDTVHHFLWMCDELIERRVTGNKAHRWLGYLQCGMVFSGEEFLDLNSMKELNRQAAEKFPEEDLVPMIYSWEGRRFDELLPDERTKAFDFVSNEFKEGRLELKAMVAAHDALRDAQRTSICSQASDAKHDFSSQGCPAGVQACIHCEEIEL